MGRLRACGRPAGERRRAVEPAAAPCKLPENPAETTMQDDLPLSGLRAICMAINVPGPAAAAILAAQGVEIVKIEPPTGDLTAHAMPGWYAEINRDATVETVDLRDAAGQARFHELLRGADLLISSHRRAALGRLGITVPALAALNPALCWVEIVGDTQAPDVPGH